MNIHEQQLGLQRAIANLPLKAAGALGADEPDWVIEDAVSAHQITFGEIGNLCETARKVLTGEIKDVSSFQKAVGDALGEEHKPVASQAAAAVNEKLLAKIMVALGKQPWRITAPPLSTPTSTASVLVPTPPAPTVTFTQSSIKQTTPLQSSPLKRGGGESPLDERHLRALARIAAGTAYNEERLIEEFRALPEGLKRAITTVDTANAIQEIAKKFLLHIDQMAALASETGLVLLGLTHPREFVKNLARRLRISETRALEIAREISEQILVKVRDTLRRLHEENPKSEIRNPKQIQNSNIQTGAKQTAPKKLGMLEEQKEKPPLPILRKGGEGIIQTPYSLNAKWNLGVPNNQSPRNNNQTDKEKNLTREDVLRGIEQPNEIVGPTGWRPSAAEGGGKFQSPISNIQTYSNIQSPTSPKQATPPSIPPLRKGEEESTGFLEEKLAGPTGAAHTEKRYTIDPYREPLA